MCDFRHDVRELNNYFYTCTKFTIVIFYKKGKLSSSRINTDNRVVEQSVASSNTNFWLQFWMNSSPRESSLRSVFPRRASQKNRLARKSRDTLERTYVSTSRYQRSRANDRSCVRATNGCRK